MNFCIAVAGVFLIAGSAAFGAQESKGLPARDKEPGEATASGKVPIPHTFSAGISTSIEDLNTLVNYGLSLPDPPPLPLPEGFHRTADRPGMTEAGRKMMAADLAKPTPRLASGQPDLNGSWRQARYGEGRGPVSAPPAPRATNEPPPEPTPDQKTQAIALATIIRPANQPVYKESRDQAKQREMWKRNVYTDPTYKCFPAGVPRIAGPAFVVQTDRSVTFLYSSKSDANAWRYVSIGGEFKADVPATAYGQSIGRWEGDTLVVEVRNLDPTTWFGEFGLFHGPNVKVTERYRRVGDVMVYQAKVEDPDLLAEPYFSTARYSTVATRRLPIESERCVRPDIDDVRTELFPVPYLPEGNR